MKLIRSKDGFSIEIEPELYSIADFAKLIESRKKNESLLIKELSYIYFFTDMTSDFQFQTNEHDRHKDLKKYLDLPADWDRDRLIDEAIETYKYLSQNPSSRLLQSVYIGVDKIKSQLESINLNERDKMGKPVWNIKQFQDTVKALPMVMESISQAEKQYIKSQVESTKIRGNKAKSMYDGVDLGKNI